MWYHPDKFEQKRPALEKRQKLVRALRGYFEVQGFWEIETPALQTMPCADKHIHGFETLPIGADLKPLPSLYLHTSPEFDMKKLLVAGAERIYQLCHVYRNGESTRLHSPEFSLLEWYRTGADYRAMMEDCEGIVKACAESVGVKSLAHRGRECDPFVEWRRISVAEAFQEYAGIDLGKYLPTLSLNPSPLREREGERSEQGEGAVVEFSKAIAAMGIRVAEDDHWDDLFFRVMAEKIEPYLGMGVPAILYDYPADMACLSRKKPSDPRYAERFELYICGVELANAFSELTDAAEQRTRFEAEMLEKQALYGFSYPVDEEFLQALEYGMPECSGCALGFDRLVMLATGAEHIDEVLWARKPF